MFRDKKTFKQLQKRDNPQQIVTNAHSNELNLRKIIAIWQKTNIFSHIDQTSVEIVDTRKRATFQPFSAENGEPG